MNWNTKGLLGTSVDLSDYDVCSHLEEDNSKAYAYFKEHDSYGIVSQYAVCRQCWNEHATAVATCHDCGGDFNNTVQWKPYDYDPQVDGDPLELCNKCVDLPCHLARKRLDNIASRR